MYSADAVAAGAKCKTSPSPHGGGKWQEDQAVEHLILKRDQGIPDMTAASGAALIGAAGELRQPLQVIVAAHDILTLACLSGGSKELAMIKAATIRLADLLNRLEALVQTYEGRAAPVGSWSAAGCNEGPGSSTPGA